MRTAATLAILALAACTPTESEPKPEPRMVGMPNPASVHCTEQGGKLEIKTGKDGGQYGICHLLDGRECEEWALFRDKKCVAPADQGVGS